MSDELTIPDYLSISRIPLSLIFVTTYSSTDIIALSIALGIAGLALATDFLDGYLARKMKSTSLRGYMLDGLGDKAFYTAIIIVALREDFIGLLLATLLIIRELTLYSLRAIKSNKESLEALRIYSTTHAFFIRIYFGCFFVWSVMKALALNANGIVLWSTALGWLACCSGVIGLYLLTKPWWVREISQS